MFRRKNAVSFAKKAATIMVSAATVAWSLGLPFLVAVPVAEAAAVSAVSAADQDTTGFGLDGRDFSVSWTNGTQPAGYVGTRIFIVPNGTSLTPSNVLTNGCLGAACQDVGFYTQYTQTTHILPQFRTTDSEGTPWAASPFTYKACVWTNATNPEITCSAAFSATSETAATVTDTNRPFIEHFGVHAANAGQNAVISAFVFDDQTSGTDFVSMGQPGIVQIFRLFYGSDVSASETATNGTRVSGNLYQFTVPSASVPSAGGTFEYYLHAKDAAGNNSYFCANPGTNTAAGCQTSPFVVNSVTPGSRTVSGTIFSGGSGLDAARIFPGGFAIASVTSASNGTYTISGLSSNTASDITAYKTGYCKQMRFETIGTSNVTGINITLNAGDCAYTGPPGGGLNSGSPFVIFSGPQEGSYGVPLSDSIRVGISQALNASTVNDTDPINAGSNVYLTTDNGTTKIAGNVLYCASNASPGCSSLFAQDTNVILFDPTANLTASTFYTLVMTEGVTSSSGQSIQGSRMGGGHNLNFNTGGGTYSGSQVATSFGSTGQFMPPYVKAMIPGPGAQAARNTDIALEFDRRMNTSTITTSSVQLWNKTANTQVTLASGDITVDANEQRFVNINPGTLAASTEYEVRMKGSVADASGIALRPPIEANNNAFVSFFLTSASSNTTAPTIYPGLASGATAVAVNTFAFEFGFTETLSFSTITSSNITMQRGANSVGITVKYDPGRNGVFVIPNDVLAPNTTYTITFTTGVTDLAGVALASQQTYTYTTGSADSTTPKVSEARCDDNTCTVRFNEPMNHDAQVDANYATSVLKSANYTVDVTSDAAPGAVLNTLSGLSLTYDAIQQAVTIKGLAGSALALTSGSTFTFTVNSGVTDLSNNAIGSVNNAWSGTTENSANTFGSFGDPGMFGPPIAGGGAPGGMFTPTGFGTFTADQFAFGQADMAFPFNPMAGLDSNVFQVRFGPGIALQNDDQVVLTFPSGTGISSASPDTFSPFYTDMNESFGAGTVAFDTALDTDGVSVDTSAYKVTVQLAISGGTPGANDQYTIDLKNIVNPSIPKDPSIGGYTVGIKVVRAGAVLVNKTSMPYFIQAGGSRSITVNIYAGSQSSPDAVSGNVFLFGGGPSGPLDKNITITNGTGTLALSSLPDGCYYFGTEPFVTLGSSDYFGQHSPEPVCVDSTNTSRTKNIVLASATAAGASVALTVKFAGISDFGGVDVDIFAGGPGRFTVKNIAGLTTPASAGYTLRLPENGTWFVGVGPAMPKGPSSTKITKQLPGVPPPPIDLIVSGLGGTPTVTTGFFTPPGVSFNSATNTLTFTFAVADKAVSGTVTDGTNALQNVQVFMHRQGFGAPANATTNASGQFTLNVSEYGSYEIGAFKDGLPPVFQPIEVLADGADAGTAIDIFYKGKQITGSNPLILKLKKGAYTISGKILDSSGNGISYAPVFASDANGNFVGGGSDSSGSYTLFVDAGVWTVKSELPPNKTDTCGTLSKSVTITTESKSSQDLRPTTSTCYEISGRVTVGGVALQNVPLFVDEWDATNSRPAAAGSFKGTSTDSSGNYTVKVAGSKTYRIGTFDPSVGEVSITQAVAAANVTGANIAITSGTITFAFTGGTASMNAFIEVKKTDGTSRLGKQQNGLASNASLTVPSGNYNYFVDIFGFGKFSGQTSTGSTVTINAGTSSFFTLSGNIKDSSSNNLSGALVTVKDTTSGLVKTDVTDSSGNYSISVKEGTYAVNSAKAGYTPGQAPANVALTANTANYDFGGSSPDQSAMVKASQVISGTVYQSGGSTAVTEGFVTATDANGAVVTSAIDPQNGSYSLPVNDGSWTVSAKAPMHAETSRSGTVTVSGADATSRNITMTADATKVSTGESKVIAANTGGSLDNTDGSGIKVTSGAGVLEAGSGNVTVEVEKSFTAPDTTNYNPLGDASFDISATGTSGTIKDLKGNTDIEIDYTSIVSQLPSGVSESDLKLAYYSTETGEYVPVEGGFTVDATNNKITGQSSHFTTFAIVYAPTASTAAAAAAAASTGGVPSGGGGSSAAASGSAATTPTPSPAPVSATPATTLDEALAKVKMPTLEKAISQMTVEELKAKIAEFKAVIQQLQQIFAQFASPVSSAGIPPGYAFAQTIKQGQRAEDVRYLQIFLNSDPDTRIAGSGPGSSLQETTLFGALTKAAVIKFQEKYASEILTPLGLTQGTGLFGPSTRAKINQLLGR